MSTHTATKVADLKAGQHFWHGGLYLAHQVDVMVNGVRVMTGARTFYFHSQTVVQVRDAD